MFFVRTLIELINKKRDFKNINFFKKEKFPPVIDQLNLKDVVINSIVTGILTLKEQSSFGSGGLNDEVLEKIPWSLIGPFLTDVIVDWKEVTSLPVGLAYLSIDSIKRIQFVVHSGWRKLDKIKAGESPQNIIEYCKAKLEGGVVKMKALRLMVMGGPGVGKTSMVRRLRGERQSVKNVPLSTDGIELGDVMLEDGTVLESWDFGGQKVYRISHQLFLCDFCVYVVMCRVTDCADVALKELQFWVDSILSRTGGGSKVQIILVTTHGDRLEPKGSRSCSQPPSQLIDWSIWKDKDFRTFSDVKVG